MYPLNAVPQLVFRISLPQYLWPSCARSNGSMITSECQHTADFFATEACSGFYIKLKQISLHLFCYSYGGYARYICETNEIRCIAYLRFSMLMKARIYEQNNRIHSTQ